MESERKTIRLSRKQIAAAEKHGGGECGRGIRKLLTEHLGAGPIELGHGLAGATKKARKAVSEARWPVAKTTQE